MKTFSPAVSPTERWLCEHVMTLDGRALVRARAPQLPEPTVEMPTARVVVRVPLERRRRDVWPLVVSLVVVVAIWCGIGVGLAYLMTR